MAEAIAALIELITSALQAGFEIFSTIVFGPWLKKSHPLLPGLPFQFSLLEMYALVKVATLTNLCAHYFMPWTTPPLYLHGAATLLAGVLWFHAVYCINGRYVTEPKRRYVTISITFPLGYFVIIAMTLDAVLIILALVFGKFSALPIPVAIWIAGALTIVVTRKLSRWALHSPTTPAVDL